MTTAVCLFFMAFASDIQGTITVNHTSFFFDYFKYMHGMCHCVCTIPNGADNCRIENGLT